MGSNLSRDSAIGPQPIADDDANATLPAPSVYNFYDPTQSSDSTSKDSKNATPQLDARARSDFPGPAQQLAASVLSDPLQPLVQGSKIDLLAVAKHLRPEFGQSFDDVDRNDKDDKNNQAETRGAVPSLKRPSPIAEVNRRYAACLRQDDFNPARGRAEAAAFEELLLPDGTPKLETSPGLALRHYFIIISPRPLYQSDVVRNFGRFF